MKIALLTNIVAPYRFDSYSALHHHARNAGGGLTVICTNRTEPQRNWPDRTPPFAQINLAGLNLYLGENRNLTFPVGVTKAIRKTRPDIVILVGFGMAQWRARNLAAQSGIPVIVQFDGWSGSDALYENRVRRYIRRQMVRTADGHIAASTRGKDWFATHGAKTEDILVSPIPVSFGNDAIPVTLSNRGFFERPFDLLWCGRTTRRKGFDTFLEIAARLVRSNIVHKIGIVGCTDTGKIKDRLCRTGLADITQTWGQLPPAQLPAHLGAARLCLFPSHNDAYGLGVVEAIACGAVALASDAVGCAPDILDPDDTLLANAPSAWVSACSNLLRNPDLWRQTRQRQASRITANTARHHANTLWQAVCHGIAKNRDYCQWN
ncbi:glycosyltransferase [Thalassospira povalilytica]|uniref:Glycosyltransferase family 4 protein n=1 Tax=Thalassospira povalilytica TaxID=732237 RepID=A0A8I1M9G2_9PROT|nr:glycosyltransferase family 4 protein [Thalassospira povalilytica]